MQLTEILRQDCVVVPLEAAEKQEAIFALADHLCDVLELDGEEALKEAVWKRETTRTTGIGHGVAIPHGKSAHCHELRMAIGKPAAPIEFGAIDGKPVDLIFLLVSPADQTGPHIQALAAVSRLLTDTDLRTQLKEAPDADTLYDLIVRAEAGQAA